jgi:hypothetical protein
MLPVPQGSHLNTAGASAAVTKPTAIQTYPATFPPTAPDSRQAVSLTACALPSHIPAHPIAPVSRQVRGSPCKHHATALAPTAPYDQQVPQLALSLKRLHQCNRATSPPTAQSAVAVLADTTHPHRSLLLFASCRCRRCRCRREGLHKRKG